MIYVNLLTHYPSFSFTLINSRKFIVIIKVLNESRYQLKTKLILDLTLTLRNNS